MKIVTIHQPEHLSYLGFYHKMTMADELIILDNVQYEKNYFQNRNQINTKDGKKYITVPVTNTKGNISDVLIAKEYQRQMQKNIATIENTYKKCPFWIQFGEDFLERYSTPFTNLEDYNISLMKWVFNHLDININIVKANDLNATGAKGDLLLDLLHKVNADKYIAGKSGKDYLDLSNWDLPVEFQDFQHPIYTQYGMTSFTPYMSIIDALFNVGKEIIPIINSVNHGQKM